MEIFLQDRLRAYLRDGGYSANEIESVLCQMPTQIARVPLQLAAVRAFTALPEAASLAAANKRIANILKQAEARGERCEQADEALMQEAEERTLLKAIREASATAVPCFKANDYTGYLQAFAVLKDPVDAFFEKVMVMVEDAAVRRNRLALLADLHREMNQVADLSRLSI